MRFQNPANGHIEEFGEATWLWVLVGGPIYFAYKQMWLQAVLLCHQAQGINEEFN